MAEFKVLVGCQNDTTGKRFEPGTTVTDADFPAEVITNWLEIGVLEAVEPDHEVTNGGGQE